MFEKDYLNLQLLLQETEKLPQRHHTVHHKPKERERVVELLLLIMLGISGTVSNLLLVINTVSVTSIKMANIYLSRKCDGHFEVQFQKL